LTGTIPAIAESNELLPWIFIPFPTAIDYSILSLIPGLTGLKRTYYPLSKDSATNSVSFYVIPMKWIYFLINSVIVSFEALSTP